jgi:hypothetical protein
MEKLMEKYMTEDVISTLTKVNRGIIHANNIGYKVNENGEVISNRGNIRKLNDNKKGYYRISIRLNGEQINIPVHKMVAYQKFGDKIFEKGIQVRHLNSNSFDNSYDNIEIGTQSKNMMDTPKEERIRRAKHASSFLKKYNHEKVISFYNNCKSYKKTMEKFDISSKSTLNFILKKVK